ncbi:MAG: AAA domain-containing protein [Pseudomonadota bacterium]
MNWHYRSRDEALIAFSNHHYYGNRLVTFPSPQTESEALHHHRIDGTYARGAGRHNEAEAKAVVALAVRRLTAALDEEETARPTLGVITFNVQQQELILDLLDAERRRDPRLEWFFEDAREEPVIVKNLENIQGDERDIMLFSVTFGPDLAGKLTMNFGALNGDGGEKRLNVAVTRARCELHVFASLDSDMIDLGRTKARGVADLKNFLTFAERGAEALPGRETGSMGPSESPFETAVAEALAAKGWEVRTQIGVSGFRIDLGVVHPDRAGAYLAGVECDGATYHRSASARDRDRIREGFLQSLGWEILRVWSTDWFMNRREALDRLSSALAALLEDDRARRAEADAAREAAAAEAAARADEEDEPYTSGSTQSPTGVDATGPASVAAPNDGDDNAPSPWAESDAKTASMENEERSDTPSPP